MSNKLQEIKENAITTKQHDFITEIPYEDFEWLIKQAETLQKIRNEAEDLYNEVIDYSDFGERVGNLL